MTKIPVKLKLVTAVILWLVNDVMNKTKEQPGNIFGVYDPDGDLRGTYKARNTAATQLDRKYCHASNDLRRSRKNTSHKERMADALTLGWYIKEYVLIDIEDVKVRDVLEEIALSLVSERINKLETDLEYWKDIAGKRLSWYHEAMKPS